MKKLFALVSISALLLQVSSIEAGSAQILLQGQQIAQAIDEVNPLGEHPTFYCSCVE